MPLRMIIDGGAVDPRDVALDRRATWIRRRSSTSRPSVFATTRRPCSTGSTASTSRSMSTSSRASWRCPCRSRAAHRGRSGTAARAGSAKAALVGRRRPHRARARDGRREARAPDDGPGLDRATPDRRGRSEPAPWPKSTFPSRPTTNLPRPRRTLNTCPSCRFGTIATTSRAGTLGLRTLRTTFRCAPAPGLPGSPTRALRGGGLRDLHSRTRSASSISAPTPSGSPRRR